MATEWPLRRWIAPGVIIPLLVFGVGVVVADPSAGETVGAAGILLGQTSAGIMLIRRSRRLEVRERKAWRGFAVALFLASTGVLVVGILLEAGVELPAFGATDVFFLAGYMFLVVTMIRLARSDAGGVGWRLTLLDALVGGIALFALVWNAFFHELIQSFRGAPVWEPAIALTYPLLDIAAVVGLMILVMRRSQYRLDLRLFFLAIGLSVQVLADFIYMSRGVGRTFAEAEPEFALLLIATACYVAAASFIDRVPRKREFPEQTAPLSAMLWPYLLATALLATHIVRYRMSVPSSDETILLDSLIIIGVIILLRQVMVISQNRSRVEEQRSELVASVSHELRTPLTAMVGYLTLLDEDPDEFPEDARREMIGESARQARHMSRLVSDLVMLARSNYRHLPLQLSEVTIGSMTTAALRSLEPSATRIKEDLRAEAIVKVDPDRVQQALGNLLSNAVRYGGGKAILVAGIEGRDLVFEVHDDGPGVPTRYEAVVWQRFERGAHRLDAVTPGLGIGLAIVDAVADSHGGSASYRSSDLLGGACFSIVIPDAVSVDEPSQDKIEARF